MHVKIETAGYFGEGKDRKRYEAGSVVEVAADVFEKNQSWMKATDEPLKEAKAKPDADIK